MSPKVNKEMIGSRVTLEDGDGSAGTIIHADPDDKKPWWLSPVPRLDVRWDDGEVDVYFGADIDDLRIEQASE